MLGAIAETNGGTKAAISLYERSAKLGDAEAQFHMAKVYLNGKGVAKNSDIGQVYLKQAADNGHTAAQVIVAGMLQMKGQLAEAFRYFQLAAEAGDAVSQTAVGMAYSNGEVVKKDEAVAAHWMRKAADQGEDMAQYLLAGMYAGGKGVPQDVVEAYYWLWLARANGMNGVDEKLASVAAYLTPHQIINATARAQKTVAQQKPKQPARPLTGA